MKTCGINTITNMVVVTTLVLYTVVIPHDHATNQKNQSAFDHEAAYFGMQDADGWRIDLVTEVLRYLGHSQRPPIKKLSLKAHQEMVINGCSTRYGIWLLHKQGMYEPLAYYIAVHEAVHYAYNHSHKRQIATHVAHYSEHAGSILGLVGAGYVARLVKKPLWLLVSCASAATIAGNKLFSHYAKKFLPRYVEQLEKEADAQAVAFMVYAQKKDLLDQILAHDEHRKNMHAQVAAHTNKYQKKIFEKNNIDPIWTTKIHINNIKEYYTDREKKSS